MATPDTEAEVAVVAVVEALVVETAVLAVVTEAVTAVAGVVISSALLDGNRAL